MSNKNILLLGAAALGAYFLIKNANAAPGDSSANDASAYATPQFTQQTQSALNPVQFSDGAQLLIQEQLRTGQLQQAYLQNLADMQAIAATQTQAQQNTAPNIAATGTFKVDGQLYQAASISDAINQSIAASAPKNTGTIVNVGNQTAPPGVVNWNAYSHY